MDNQEFWKKGKISSISRLKKMQNESKLSNTNNRCNLNNDEIIIKLITIAKRGLLSIESTVEEYNIVELAEKQLLNK